MKFRELHNWPSDPLDAGLIQKELCRLVIRESCFKKLEYITAVDTAYNRDTNHLYAAAVTMKYPEFVETEKVVAEMKISFPYIPGLLGFREGPVILQAFSQLIFKPDLVIFAGHGIDHPISFGIASHLGLLLDIPSIGCARKRLVGQYSEPDIQAGSFNVLSHKNIDCGYVYRSRTKVKPIFISPGHKCGLEDSFEIIKNCIGNYRMPQPLRIAHLYASKFRRVNERRNQKYCDSNNNRDFKEKILSS